jgi:ABC-type phosphate transport system substrate-binding protein
MNAIRKGLSALALFVLSIPLLAQTTPPASPKVVVITGNRFSYKIVQEWIDEYSKLKPDVQIIIEARGSNDPATFQILAEVYEPEEALKNGREYINVGRYAVLPVATTNSEFANYFVEKGLEEDLLKQIFFNDIYADKESQAKIEAPYTVYTRLQKAGVPFVFAKYFGYQQKDIKGTSIAGADEHLVKALLRDPNGVTYLPLTLIYDQQTRKPIDKLTVLPVDLNGNGKINSEEKIYGDLDKAIEQLEARSQDDIKNVPIEYLHLSVDKKTATPEAIDFLKWVNENGQRYLHKFGYLRPEAKYFEKEKFKEFAAGHNR